MRRWTDVATAAVAIIGLSVTLAGIVFVAGGYKTRLEAEETETKDTKVFKAAVRPEIAVIHVELHAVMDHFHIPHDKEEE
jgi:hypothetical protein